MKHWAQRRAVAALRHAPMVGLATIFATAGVIPSSGAIWYSPLWALTGSATVSGGYDSNLFARKDGDGAGYLTVEPAVKLARRASLTKFETTFSAAGTTFFGGHVSDSLDPSLAVSVQYPYDDTELPTQEGDFKIYRRSVANADLGRRVQANEGRANWDGIIIDTGKTLITGTGAASYTNFREHSLNTNDSFSGGVGLAYRPDELIRLEGDYTLTWAESDPHDSARENARSLEHAFTVRARGHLLPKVSGSAYMGISFVSYSGALSRSNNEFVGGADLTWSPLDRFSLLARASRYVDFTPDGNTAIRNSLQFEARRGIGLGYTVHAAAGYARTSYAQTATYRKDDVYTLGGGIDYKVTERLQATLGYTWTDHSSDVVMDDYFRNLVKASVTYGF